MVAITMQRGSYKQLQDEAPVFMLANGKSCYIGIKEAQSLLSNASLSVRTKKDNVVKLDKKTARCCFGFYEVCDEQQQTSMA